jgi:hypothetical protein
MGGSLRVMNDSKGPTELVQHSAHGGVPIGARALLDILLIWLGYIDRLSQWRRGGYLLVQTVSTCLRGAFRMGWGRGGGSASCGGSAAVYVWRYHFLSRTPIPFSLFIFCLCLENLLLNSFVLPLTVANKFEGTCH